MAGSLAVRGLIGLSSEIVCSLHEVRLLVAVLD